MKNILSLFVVLLFSICSLNAQSKSEKAVAEAVIALHNNVVKPDREALDGLVSANLSYGHSGGKVENKEQFIDFLFNGPFKFTSINTTEQTIQVSGENAVVRHVFIGKATNSGVPTEIRIGNLMVWRKEGRKWKILARQAFKL